MEDAVVSVEGLTHHYGTLRAVNNISFSVRGGQIFSLLGPNGAGKTTTINVLITLIPIQKGRAIVAGFDVAKEKGEVRKSIGVVFQDQRLDRDLTVWETLDFHGRIYSISEEIRRPRIDELLSLVELVDKRDELTKNLSGGMKRRLEIARGLLVRPKVLFLDEPTVGLDPQTRKRIWAYIKKVNRKEGVTVLLTTHYMDEADQNSDVVCIMDRGEIIVSGTPDDLKSSLHQDFLQLHTENNPRAHELIGEMPCVSKIENASSGLIVKFKENAPLTSELIELLRKEGIRIMTITWVNPTLDDVFIRYTGRGLNEIDQELSG
jgi:ABC-2 type transport system ATP-binding protein